MSRFVTLAFQKAAETSRKFSIVFDLFSRCHSMYDQRYITPVEVDTLGKFIMISTIIFTNSIFDFQRTTLQVLPGKVPYGIHHTQTSHAREAHNPMAERVGSWCGFWTHGGTGGRKHPQLVQQKGAQIRQCGETSQQNEEPFYKCCSTEHITKTSHQKEMFINKRSDHFLIKNCLQTNAHIYYRKS